MSQTEFFQMFQLLMILFVAFFFAYNIIQNFRLCPTFLFCIKSYICIYTVIIGIRTLYVVNYECFHKYEIWRYHRFS